MTDLVFDCLDVRPQSYGTSPTLLFRLRIAALATTKVHAIALRCQIRIEPQRRRYEPEEAELLTYLFGERARWGDTLKPMEFTNVSVVVPSFTGSTEVELAVPCTYDLDVAAGKYFHALQDGVIPMVLLFSGTVFGKGDHGFWVQQVPWNAEANYRMPVSVWRDLMNIYFPGSSWIKLHRDTVDALLRYKARHALPTWDAAVEMLLAGAREATPHER